MTKGIIQMNPFESYNRKTHQFNMAFDATVLKPVAKIYKAVLPDFVRNGVNNFYNNINMLPTIANDLLQAEGQYAIKDTWRFLINSTMGIAGIFDVAPDLNCLPIVTTLVLLCKMGRSKLSLNCHPFYGSEYGS